MEETIPHSAQLSAEVNAPARVTLYDPHGTALEVDAAAVDYCIQQYGFSRVQTDPAAAHAELDALFDAARDAVRRMVDGVTETGLIDPHPDAAYAAACVAMDALTAAWGTLHHTLHARYGVVEQGQPVTLRAVDGSSEITVDPGQVERYVEQGYVLPEGA